MKTTKHQPNIKALIHLYANGEPKELCSGNVSSTAVDSEGDTVLYTYSTRLATRRKVGKNTVFVVNVKNYSMSSNRHKRYLHNSIGCELATPHVFENDGETLDFEKAKKNFLRHMKEGYAVTIPTAGYYIGMGQASTVEYVRLEVLKFVERMQNKRVHKITEYEIEQTYTLMLKTQWFAKAFSIKNPKFTALFAKFKKVAGVYIERTEGRALRLELEKKEAKQNSKKFVDNLVEQHSVTWQLAIGSIATQYREDVQKWRNGDGSASCAGLHSWVQQRLTQPFLDLRELWSTCLRKFYWTEFPRLVDLFIYLYGKLIPDGTLLKEEDSELLRVKNGNVETSKGAVLSELLVQKAFQKWKPELSMAEVGFGREERVGVYPLQSIKDGIVTIGCHRIRTQEILELAERQGW